MKTNIIHAAFVVVSMWGLHACSEIECPLDNVVMMQSNLYDAESKSKLTLADSLTVRPYGRDTVLLNRAQGITDFLLPLRHAGECDTLLLQWSNALGMRSVDTLVVEHVPQMHFESVDCPMAVFHTLRRVTWAVDAHGEMPMAIDSVALVRTLVEYEDVENLKIFVRGAASQ